MSVRSETRSGVNSERCWTERRLVSVFRLSLFVHRTEHSVCCQSRTCVYLSLNACVHAVAIT